MANPWEYDVFLSFRGEDTRKTFTGHLYSALRHATIRTFIDEEELERGEYLAPEFTRAIQSSRIAIVVFSKDYASSSWCLEELVQILECKEKGKQIVFPIFYDVYPSQVRNQRDNYGIALAKHEQRFGGNDDNNKVQKWRDALTKVGNMSGWDLHGLANGYESKLIDEIIKEVLLVVTRIPVFVPNHVVGLESKVEHVVQYMWGEHDDNNVRMIGIYGVGGIGKTTLAKVLYNKFFGYFERSCFIEISSGISEIKSLQERFLSKLRNGRIEVVDSEGEGIMKIKNSFETKKCLIVLDNLENIDQFNALCRERYWFGEGSRLILTTRDAQVLNELKEDERYEVKTLNRVDSLKLFSQHAFKGCLLPKEDYGIVAYCGGMPLALEVIGAYLYNKSKEEWISASEKLKKIPHDKVQAKLKISYDGLQDDNIKSLFLDLVCFSNGVSKETIASMGNFSIIEIRDLVDRCLINCEGSRIRMHSLIREMGREIIRLESPKNPGERSRLWCPNDIHDVLKEEKGTKTIEMIVFNFLTKNMKYNTKAFKKMENLRFLQIDEVHLYGNLKHLPNKMLRCLRWNQCPLEYIPFSSFFEKLVHLELSWSNIKEFRAPLKHFPCLESMDLSSSEHLTRTPDFSGAQNLRRLSFTWCSSLVEVHSSIGKLGKLIYLDFKGCQKLKKLPNNLSHLSSLQHLDLSYSLKLLELPQDFGNLTSLQELILGHSNIYGLPSNLSHLFRLQSVHLSLCNNLEVLPKLPHSVKNFSLDNCKNLKVIQELPPNLRKIYITYCKNLEMLPKLPSNLEKISLDGCEKLKMLPELPLNLKKIRLCGCKKLEKLPELPHELEILDAENCEYMDKVPNLSHYRKLKELNLTGCRNLKMLPELPHQLEILRAKHCVSVKTVPNLSYCTRLETLNLQGCRKLKKYQGWDQHLWDLSESIIKEVLIGSKLDFSIICTFTCNEIPSWITCKEEGSSICIQWPVLCNNSENYTLGLVGFIFWVVFKACALQPPYPYEYFIIHINGFLVAINVFQLGVEEISCLHLSSRSSLRNFGFCTDIKSGEFMILTLKTSVEASMVKQIGVAALYRDTDGLQFVPITKLW